MTDFILGVIFVAGFVLSALMFWCGILVMKGGGK